MHTFAKNRLSIYIFLLILIGGFFRFYNLNWGSPFYFHPDERNIASSILNIHLPNEMNPHFFAYGSFPIYVIYFTGYSLNLLNKSYLDFEQIIIISRFYSAILSILLIPSIYFVGTKLINKRVGILSATFCTLSVGLIQFSHFGTFEMWLTFLGVWFFYFSLYLIKKITLKTIFIVGIIFGLLMATKISSLPLLLIPAFAILLNSLLTKDKKNSNYFNSKYISVFVVIFCVALAVFFISSPFVLLDFPSFLSSVKYETSVAFGTLPVFYTGEFFNSVPILFQFTKIYPFLINPLMTIVFVPSLMYLNLIFTPFKKNNFPYYLLFSTYYLLFIPQTFLFTKWTRYIMPTLPFVYLIIAIAIENFFKKNILSIKYLVLSFIIVINVVFAVSYFITAFVKEDTRIKASFWAKENIRSQAATISEIYDMGIVPFNPHLSNIALFNFYDLDQTPDIKSLELENFLSQSQYIILPSQRILKTRLVNNDKFPNGYRFYNNLINGKLGYKKVYETSCDIFCKIIYLGDPVFSFEETANVFDRPTVFIFQKNNH